jgi:hypothetical protein
MSRACSAGRRLREALRQPVAQPASFRSTASRYLRPPDTSSVSPVMYFESDDARYTAVGEMSSG